MVSDSETYQAFDTDYEIVRFIGCDKFFHEPDIQWIYKWYLEAYQSMQSSINCNTYLLEEFQK